MAACEHEALIEVHVWPGPQDAGGAARRRSTWARPTTKSSRHFIAQYGGQQFLGAPIDKGFNRLAWLFPYAVAGRACCCSALPRRGGRDRHDSAGPAATHPNDPALEERLDDELRNLD